MDDAAAKAYVAKSLKKLGFAASFLEQGGRITRYARGGRFPSYGLGGPLSEEDFAASLNPRSTYGIDPSANNRFGKTYGVGPQPVATRSSFMQQKPAGPGFPNVGRTFGRPTAPQIPGGDRGRITSANSVMGAPGVVDNGSGLLLASKSAPQGHLLPTVDATAHKNAAFRFQPPAVNRAGGDFPGQTPFHPTTNIGLPKAPDGSFSYTPKAGGQDATGTGAGGVTQYAPQRDMVGYAGDALRMLLAAVPTRNPSDLKFREFRPGIREVGVNEAAYEMGRNELAGAARQAGRMQGSSLAEATAGRLGALSAQTQGITQLEGQRAEALQQDQGRFDQQQMAVAQHNNQGQNSVDLYNNQVHQQRAAGMAAAKAASMQQAMQNISARRATENSQANMMGSQAILAQHMQQNARVQQIQTELNAIGKVDPVADPAGYAKYKALTAELNAITQRTSQELMGQYAEQLGWKPKAQQPKTAYRKGGSLTLDDRLALERGKSRNRIQENAIKEIERLNREILRIGARAGLPRAQVSRYGSKKR